MGLAKNNFALGGVLRHGEAARAGTAADTMPVSVASAVAAGSDGCPR